LAHLLEHRQVEVLSNSLEVAYQKIFEDPAMEKKRKKFRAAANRDSKETLARLYELVALAVLRFRQWQFLEHEPSGKKGKRSPDHLMLALEGSKVLVEVATLNLAEKVQQYERRRRQLERFIQGELAKRGVDSDVHVYCSYKRIPSPRAFVAKLPKLREAVLASLKCARLHASYALPGGGRVDVNLKGSVEKVIHTHAGEKMVELEGMWQRMNHQAGEARLRVEQGRDLREILGQRIISVVRKKEKQVLGSDLDFPAVIAVGMGHHDTSIQEALSGLRLELTRAKDYPPFERVKAILLLSLFDVEFDRLYRKVSEHPLTAALAEPVVQQARKLPVATVQACWVPLASDLGAEPVGPVRDILNVLGRHQELEEESATHFWIPVFPELVRQGELQEVPPAGE